MIARVWHGYTTPENADAYQDVLLGTVMPSIESKNIDGFRGFHSLRRDDQVGPDGAPETEFVTILWFESEEQIAAFAGDDPTVAHVPEAARAALSRFDARAAHFRHVGGAGPG